MIDQAARVSAIGNWPPYNIERTAEDEYRILMAVAGFASEEIELLQQQNTLFVSGEKHPEPEGVEVLHRGLATRAFKQRFNLADHVKVRSASMDNGMLLIDLVREIPEALKPRRIEVTQTSAPVPMASSEAPQQIAKIDQAAA